MSAYWKGSMITLISSIITQQNYITQSNILVAPIMESLDR